MGEELVAACQNSCKIWQGQALGDMTQISVHEIPQRRVNGILARREVLAEEEEEEQQTHVVN